MVDFDFLNVVNVISQVMFDGNTTVGGLVIMLIIAFIMMMILSAVKAPVSYSLVPMLVLAIIFAGVGIMDPTVSFVIIILSAVLIAMTARRIVSS